MAGVTNIVAKSGQTVGEAAVAAAHGKKPVLDVLVTKSGAPSGNLSQSLESLHSAETQISEIIYLLRSAVIIQIETLKNTSGIISRVQSLRSSVGGYVSSELPQLNTIETMLTNKQTS